jgi:hypothetical protein
MWFCISLLCPSYPKGTESKNDDEEVEKVTDEHV